MEDDGKINDTRIVIYDLTGDLQVLKSYNDNNAFTQDNNRLFQGAILLNNDEKSEIHTIDDVIDCLGKNEKYITTIDSYNKL